MASLALVFAASVASIPAAYTGNWAIAQHGCASGRNHVSMHIDRSAVNNGEFDARVDRVSVLSRRRLRITMTWVSDEDEQRQFAIWTLSPNGRALTEQLFEKGTSRRGLTHWVRCA